MSGSSRPPRSCAPGSRRITRQPRSCGSAITGRARAGRASIGHSPSTRRSAWAGSTASASGSTRRPSHNASRRDARAASGAQSTSPTSAACRPPAGCDQPASRRSRRGPPSERGSTRTSAPVAELSEAETARFRADTAAWADWERRPPSYRKAVTHWVTSAKREETRRGRFEALLVDSAAGRRVKPMRVGRNDAG